MCVREFSAGSPLGVESVPGNWILEGTSESHLLLACSVLRLCDRGCHPGTPKSDHRCRLGFKNSHSLGSPVQFHSIRLGQVDGSCISESDPVGRPTQKCRPRAAWSHVLLRPACALSTWDPRACIAVCGWHTRPELWKLHFIFTTTLGTAFD